MGKGGSSGLPPGITPEVWESMKQQQRAMAKNKIQSDTETVSQANAAPVTNHVNKAGGDEWVTVMNKKKKKQQSLKGDEDINSKLNGLSINNNNNNVSKAAKPKKPKKKKAPAPVVAISSDVEEENVVQIKSVSNKLSNAAGGTNDPPFDPVKKTSKFKEEAERD